MTDCSDMSLDGDGVDRDDGFAIFFFIYAGIAIILTAISCVLVLRWGDHRFNVTRLLFIMHFTLLLEEFFSLPYLFSWNDGLCAATGFLRAYFSLSNAMATSFLMMFFYVSHRGQSGLSISISSYMRAWGLRLIVIFPLITALPLSTGAYGKSYDIWCRFKDSRLEDRLWELFTCNFWAMLVIVSSGFMILRSIRAVFKIHTDIGGRLLSSLGAYSIVSLICWLAHVIVNFWEFSPAKKTSRENIDAFQDVLTQSMGIAYAIILFHDISMVLDMRSGSEVFTNSSLVSASILNWEGMISDRPSLIKDPIELNDVTNPVNFAQRSSQQSDLDDL